ncbi:hypothetical protein [Flavobacterium aquidurense]|uniref:hypothetical protein n=1 Tax=Flavobacterium aquidurense TaxID=362413 RepID=UPI00285A76BA|nr:hypothetical protein [Flavobacterium aquidurense]MDR7371451.1 hypothetical protein [Flavobacterium aquidurense]
MKKSIILFYLIISVFISCGKGNQNIKTIEEENQNIKNVNEEKVIDFYNFKHYLEESDYSYEIKITNVILEKHKNEFEVEKEKYAVPEKIDGLSITIEFDIKNPYSKTMRIPFPEYYEIGSEEFEGLDGYIYSRNAKIHISNSTTITNSKGNPLSTFSKYNDDPISRKLIVEFKPNETKKIVVKFDNTFPATINKLTFIGFNKHLQKKVQNYYSLSKEEQEEYLADKSTEYGLVIDLKTKEIIDLITLNK